MIKREQYLSKLRKLRDKDLIKVVTGVRRSGKSTLLEQFRDELLESGVSTNCIQFHNFELSSPFATPNSEDIFNDIINNIKPDTKNYVFLDEIQTLDNFEKILDNLYARGNIDLYVTGSNAYFLSSDLATLLTGRQIEIKVLPFSFKEYLQSTDEPNSSNETLFAKYLRNGGLPQAVELFKTDETLALEYLSGIYSTVVLTDIVTREGVSKDTEALNNIMRFVFENTGNPISPNKIANYMKANYRNIASATVEKFLSAAVDSFVIYSSSRFDIKGKELLQTLQKYYLVDTGLRRVLLDKGAQFDSGRALENVIYLELLRRGYTVYTGKTKSNKEVDFVARNSLGVIEYYQVTESMRSEDTRIRELSALESIDDNNDKFILSLDPGENNYSGIRQLNAIDWLLSN